MAAHGHGLAGSGEVRPRRARLSSVRASGVHYQANRTQRRGWEGCGGSWPRGAPTPARARHGGGGGNGEYALTKPQTTRLRGGRGGEKHDAAKDELADAFLQWQARKAMAKLGRQWRSCCCSVAARGRGEGYANGTDDLVRQACGVLLKSWPAMPGRPWRVATRAGDWRQVSPTRRSLSDGCQVL